MSDHRIIIRQHRPWQRTGLTAIVVAVLMLSGFALYRYTRQSTVADFEKATSERDRLMQERRELTQQLRAAKSEISRLRDEVAYAQQAQTIDGEACNSLKATMGKLESEVGGLREQLAFYRGIASPNETKAGVRVQEFKVRKKDAGWQYELVLIQSVREESRIAGTAEVRIDGQQAGKPQTLTLGALVTAGEKNLVFSFKYFEEFSGEFKLPQGFKPMKMLISLDPADDRPTVTDEFEWATIESQERSSD
jgi:outer membrane murein-binding lipoprotein Lpp